MQSIINFEVNVMHYQHELVELGYRWPSTGLKKASPWQNQTTLFPPRDMRFLSSLSSLQDTCVGNVFYTN